MAGVPPAQRAAARISRRDRARGIPPVSRMACLLGLAEQVCDRLTGAGGLGRAVGTQPRCRRYTEDVEKRGGEVLRRYRSVFDVSANLVGSTINHASLYAGASKKR